VLASRYTWLEDGIIDPSIPGPWIAAAEPGPTKAEDVHRHIGWHPKQCRERSTRAAGGGVCPERVARKPHVLRTTAEDGTAAGPGGLARGARAGHGQRTADFLGPVCGDDHPYISRSVSHRQVVLINGA